MAINNIILNVNVDDINGQSTVLTHLLTYSKETGVLPQKLEDIAIVPRYIFKNNQGIRNVQQLRQDFQKLTREENWLEQLEEILKDCTDIAGTPLLESNFKFMLPTSIGLGNIIDSDMLYFVTKQEHHLAAFDSAKRFEGKLIKCVCANFINDFYSQYNIDKEILNFEDAILSLAKQVKSSTSVEEVADYIKDKPFFIVDRLLNEGFDAVIQDDTDSYINLLNGIYTPYYDVGIKTIDISSLSDENYYTEMCNMLNITPNYELYRIFKDEFFNKTDKEKLLFLSSSEFISNAICQYIKQTFN